MEENKSSIPYKPNTRQIQFYKVSQNVTKPNLSHKDQAKQNRINHDQVKPINTTPKYCLVLYHPYCQSEIQIQSFNTVLLRMSTRRSTAQAHTHTKLKSRSLKYVKQKTILKPN